MRMEMDKIRRHKSSEKSIAREVLLSVFANPLYSYIVFVDCKIKINTEKGDILCMKT